jgi:cytochrome P450
MLAGYETTSTALAYTTYALATHPEILEKLQAEIDQFPLSTDNNDDDGEMKKYPDYDIVAQMPYMDMVVTEVLRMYPIVPEVVQRRAMEDTIVKGVKIEKGNYMFLCCRCVSIVCDLVNATYLVKEEKYLFLDLLLSNEVFCICLRYCNKT